jgi:hypothetical protein
MAATETADRVQTADRVRTSAAPRTTRLIGDETKLSLKTTEFWAMVGVIPAILIATPSPTRSATCAHGHSLPQSRSAT